MEESKQRRSHETKNFIMFGRTHQIVRQNFNFGGLPDISWWIRWTPLSSDKPRQTYPQVWANWSDEEFLIPAMFGRTYPVVSANTPSSLGELKCWRDPDPCCVRPNLSLIRPNLPFCSVELLHCSGEPAVCADFFLWGNLKIFMEIFTLP